MTEVSSNEKLSRKGMVAPPRFGTTDDYLAALLFGSISAAKEFETHYLELNPPEVKSNA